MSPGHDEGPGVGTEASSNSTINAGGVNTEDTWIGQGRLDGMPDDTDGTVDPFFAANADRLIAERAATGEPFTADDVWLAGLGRPEHPNQIGQAFRLAAKHRVIVRCGWYRPSTRSGRNGSALAVWRGGCEAPR